MSIVRVRTAVAVVGLLVLGAVLTGALLRSAIGTSAPQAGVHRGWLLVVPPLVAIAGLAAGRGWGRWAGLATAIAVLPWAGVLTFDPLTGGGPWAITSLIAALLIIAALTGRPMIGRYEGRESSAIWTGPRMNWLRWAMICNLASVFGLLSFVGAYPFRFGGYFVAFLALMAGLLSGILLLARQKTAGLLLVWLGCLLIPPVGFLFVRTSTRNVSEMLLFAVVFLPGLVTGWATAFVFGRPVWRFLRS